MNAAARRVLRAMCGITEQDAASFPSGEVTETEWLASADPARLLDFLISREVSNRKLRLFACACCRRILHLMPEQVCVTVIETAERLADGEATSDEVARLKLTMRDLSAQYYAQEGDSPAALAEFGAIIAAGSALGGDVPTTPPEAFRYHLAARAWAPASAAAFDRGGPDAERTELAAECELLRDIFGNPFRPTRFLPTWRTEAARAVAQTAYHERAFEWMPVLADALQDAGCDEPGVIDHCRRSGPHVRGCWVVDSVLGRR